MSCSWEMSFVFENKLLNLYSEGCDSNYPEIKEIHPKQKVRFSGIIQNDANPDSIINSKIGFVLIPKQEIVRLSDFLNTINKERTNKNNIIWSVPYNFPIR